MMDLKADALEKIKELWGKAEELLSDERSRMYVIVGGTAVLAMLYLTTAVIPKSYDFAKTSRQINEFNDAINRVNDRVKRLNEMTNRLNALKKEFEDYSKGLPNQKEIPEILEELSSSARTSGVRILSITPSDLTAAEGGKVGSEYYREMSISITAKSGYHQLGSFVSSLETGERFITIESLQIQYDRNFPRKHNISMVLKTYVAVEDEKK